MTDRFPDRRPQTSLLIYDAQCRLCVTAKEGLERLEAGTAACDIRMIAYQSEEARQALGAQYRIGRPDAAYLVDSDGKVAKGLDAFIPLLPGLRGGRFLTRLFGIPGVKHLGNILYRLVARYRYRLFGAVPVDSCPGSGAPNRTQGASDIPPCPNQPTNSP